MSLEELVPILNTAVGPVILISGVGLLLLSMTNRFGRVIDRSRQLTHDHRTGEEALRRRAAAQLQILLRRARLLRAAISLAAFSALSASLLIVVLFLTAVLRIDVAVPIIALFVVCIGCLIGSLLLMIRDVNLSLSALTLEVACLEDPRDEPAERPESLRLAAGDSVREPRDRPAPVSLSRRVGLGA